MPSIWNLPATTGGQQLAIRYCEFLIYSAGGTPDSLRRFGIFYRQLAPTKMAIRNCGFLIYSAGGAEDRSPARERWEHRNGEMQSAVGATHAFSLLLVTAISGPASKSNFIALTPPND